ncbi:hypothetical protein SLE2022_084490 [Rubroshorea leprosula]
MATAASLLASNPLKWKQNFTPLLHPPRLIPSPLFKPSKFSGTLISQGPPKLTVKCSFFSNMKILASSNLDREREISADPFETVVDTVIKALNALKKPVIAAILLGLLLMYDPKSAWAASGGRMGGRSFSSRSSGSSSSRSTTSSSKSSSPSASSSSPSRGYSSSSSPSSYSSSSSPSSYSSSSSPSRSYSSSSSPSSYSSSSSPPSYSSSSSPSRSYSSSSSPSRSYSSSSSPSRSYSSYSSPSSYSSSSSPSSYSSWSSSSSSPSRSYSSSISYDAPGDGSSEEPAVPDEGIIQKQLTQLEPESEPQHVVAIPTQNIDGYHASRPGAGSRSYWTLVAALFLTLFVLVSVIFYNSFRGTAIEKTSILKLQYSLSVTKQVLHSIFFLSETTLALLRNPDYCISGYSSADVKRSIEDGEKRFNQLSIEERGKFDEETLVNVNNIKRQSTTKQKASGFSNEYIVITILVAAEGEALQKLASVPASKIMAVEVLWTPQNENDTLSERELLEDYPLLRPL